MTGRKKTAGSGTIHISLPAWHLCPIMSTRAWSHTTKTIATVQARQARVTSLTKTLFRFMIRTLCRVNFGKAKIMYAHPYRKSSTLLNSCNRNAKIAVRIHNFSCEFRDRQRQKRDLKNADLQIVAEYLLSQGRRVCDWRMTAPYSSVMPTIRLGLSC